LNTVVIGISTDKLADQEKFTKKEDLNFALFADPDKKVSRAYGVLLPRGFASRTTFVIDSKGTIRKIYKVSNPKAHPQEVLDYVKANLGKSK
jgi:peroxiredoxin Q/BCP